MIRAVRTVLAAVVVLALAGTTTACGGGDGRSEAGTDGAGRSLTAVEAERLALMRYVNYRGGAVRGVIQAPGSDGFSAQVLVDFRRHLGLAVLSRPGDGSGPPTLAAWDGDRVWVTGRTVKDPFGGRLPPADAWKVARLNPKNPMDLFLVLALQLGSDRPENPQLLRQSSARHLREAHLDGTPVSVFSGPRPAEGAAGPSRTTYWLDRSGGLLRFEAALGRGSYVFDVEKVVPYQQLPTLVERLSRGSR